MEEIYARDGIVVGRVKRGKEVVKPWVSRGVFFRTFFSLLKRKCKHSRVNPSAPKGHLLLHKGGFGTHRFMENKKREPCGSLFL